MNKSEIKITESTEEENEWAHTQMAEYIRQQLSFRGKLEVPKNYVVKENGTIIAGIKTCFYLEEGLAIDVLFVHEDYRHKGLGSLLLKKVEDEAKSLGAKFANLFTFDFQAKDFYLKHGYEIFGVLDNCPTGHQCFYMKKQL